MPRSPLVPLAAALLAGALLAAPAAAKQKPDAAAAPARPAREGVVAYDRTLFGGMSWRLVGPFRGGRVTAVTGVPGEPRLYYMGATGGGVWRSTDAGASWRAISDSTFGTGSVGAIAVAPSDPNVIVVGMGELPIRGNVSHGDGVYRSTDAGRSWRHVGLERTSQIARVRIHPRDPDLVYVAALGRVFGPNPERGVFRSKDGGRTWDRILFVDEDTGASDLAMDPANPRILYAGFWQVRRRPWSLESGGKGSGLWKSVDGGDTWTKLTGQEGDESGLPKGTLGKITVTVSPARPERVWAMIEASDGGLFRSDDAGKTWQRVNEERNLRQRAWYFSRIQADPKDPDRIWVLNVRLHLSKDGGRTFTPVRTPHPDHHDHWIDPGDPDRIINGNDGGACVTEDGGRTWSSIENQPTAQFYRVAVDDQFPYRLYGAQQDNSTVSIPSRTTGWGIERTDWYDVGGGESGWIAPKPGDPDVVYAGSYGGYLTRFDRRTQQQRDINVYPDNPMGAGAEAMKYRFQWNFPIVASRHDRDVLYTCANVVFRTRNEGQTWEAISPDLTRNDPSKLGPSGGPITKDNTSVEYYCTIFAFAESPQDAKVLWTGSDDGRIHVTRDGGASWSDVTPKGLPEWHQVNAIDASPHDPAVAYAAVTGYKMDDFSPQVWKTSDFGRSWRKAVNGLPAGSFVRVVREDPARRGLLYAGTETAVWVSFDDGERWQSLQLGLPAVPITDLAVKDGDLVAATQGRSFWVLDDLAPLRQLTGEVAKSERWFYEPSRTVRFAGAGVPRTDAGQNPPPGARLRWYLKQAPPDSVPVTLEILDASGAPVRKFDRKGEVFADTTRERGPRFRVPAKAGMNEFVWDLRHPGATRFEGLVLWGGGLEGPVAVPGRYRARLTVGAWSQIRDFEVVKDPRLATTDEDFRAQYELHARIRDKLTETHDATAGIRDVRGQIDEVLERAKRSGREAAIADSAKALGRRLTDIEEALYQTKSKSEQDPLNFPIRLNNKLALLGETVSSADARPTDPSYVVYDDLARRIDAELAKLRQAMGPDLEAFNRQVVEAGVPAVAPKPAVGAR
jgi:photosystem II stability/assembly factor-like uncharacterized protein